MDRIEKCVELFLTRNYSFKHPLILALSGGVDSSVLARVLLRMKKKREYDLHILHIDHSWRKDSLSQALSLQKKFNEMEIPFTLITLEPPANQRNLEEVARDARLAHFEEMAQILGAEAVLLAHHQDDLAETMLKRIFEASLFPFWNAIDEVTSYNNTILWRPLLGVSKKEIITYARENQIDYLVDSTEQDERFLRNRMRAKLIPDLENSFGKNLSGNLASLREQSKKLRDYLRMRTAIFHEAIQELEKEFLLDLRKVTFPIYEYEIEFFLTDFCRKHDVALSSEQKEQIARLLVDGGKEGVFTTASLIVKIRGRRVYFELTSNQKLGQVEEINQIIMS